MGKNQTATLSDVLRKAMNESGLSFYRIAKDTGITSQSLLRFQRGDHSLHLSKADALANYLGLRLVPDPEAKPPQSTPENLARPMLAKRRAKPTRRPGAANKAKRPARRRPKGAKI